MARENAYESCLLLNDGALIYTSRRKLPCDQTSGQISHQIAPLFHLSEFQLLQAVLESRLPLRRKKQETRRGNRALLQPTPSVFLESVQCSYGMRLRAD